MMKAYILSDDDFEKLTAAIDRDPKHGYDGGSSVILNKEEQLAFDAAQRFFNYQIRKWIDKVKQ